MLEPRNLMPCFNTCLLKSRNLPPRLRTPWEQNQTSLKDDTHTDSVNSVCNWIGLLLTIQPPNSQTFADDNQ